jgi:tol-pal system protein YbgF
MVSCHWRAPAAAAALLLTSSLCGWAVPARAQTPLPETPAEDPLSVHDAKRLDRMEKVMRELRAIVFQARDTKQPVVVQFADTDTRIQELTNRVSDLEQSLTRINGQLETTAHALEESRKADADLAAQVKALTDQLAQAQQQAQAAAPPPPAAEPAPPPTAAEAKQTAAEDFAKARQLMLGGDYDGAEAAFAAYVQTYPDGPRTPEANYWWGKTLTVKGAQAQAASAYIASIRGWPKTAWAPDAVVELARALTGLKKLQDACATLAELPRRYPKAPAAITTRAAAASRQAKCAG